MGYHNKLIWVPFEPKHLLSFDDADALQLIQSGGAELMKENFSRTAILKETGDVICCGGYHEFIFKTKFNAWAFLTTKAKDHVLEITKYVKRTLQESDAPRIECHTIAGFDKAFKFAKAVGFKCETPEPIENYTFDLQSVYQHSIIKNKKE